MKTKTCFKWGFVFAVLLGAMWLLVHTLERKPQVAQKSLPRMVNVGTLSDDQIRELYKLVVVGNPSFNPNQKFLPPTNSVMITNNEQLRLLVEQTEADRKKLVQQ